MFVIQILTRGVVSSSSHRELPGFVEHRPGRQGRGHRVFFLE